MRFMPITSSAKKAHRSSLRKQAQNDVRRTEVRGAMKAIRKGKTAKEDLAKAYKAIDKALKRGLIKKNTAARRKALASKMAKGK
jgi:small subunit ribosomal protein S20